jgi:hypothetical protein
VKREHSHAGIVAFITGLIVFSLLQANDQECLRVGVSELKAKVSALEGQKLAVIGPRYEHTMENHTAMIADLNARLTNVNKKANSALSVKQGGLADATLFEMPEPLEVVRK